MSSGYPPLGCAFEGVILGTGKAGTTNSKRYHTVSLGYPRFSGALLWQGFHPDPTNARPEPEPDPQFSILSVLCVICRLLFKLGQGIDPQKPLKLPFDRHFPAIHTPKQKHTPKTPFFLLIMCNAMLAF